MQLTASAEWKLVPQAIKMSRRHLRIMGICSLRPPSTTGEMKKRERARERQTDRQRDRGTGRVSHNGALCSDNPN